MTTNKPERAAMAHSKAPDESRALPVCDGRGKLLFRFDGECETIEVRRNGETSWISVAELRERWRRR